ncbi:MAG: NAD-dependent epimerase/dehydratase family protein [Bryobacteraceae bacterium]|nr:NAD-dependent epimerase/dehydratase family protein [Bryobacteraceae bacterium]
MKVLVIGGTLFIGRVLVRNLLAGGHDVAVLHRKDAHGFGPDVENLTADRNDPDSVRRAVGSRRFDAVFDNVYDWERGTTAEHVAGSARACGGNLSRYVFLSSVAAYGDGLDHRPDDPLAPDGHPIAYVRHKASSERALFRMRHQEGLPVVTIRPPFVYGPENPFYREAFFWDRLEAGRPIVIPDDGSRFMQFAYVSDVAWLCERVLSAPAAVGRAFNVGNDRPVTQLEAVRAVAAPAGKEPRLVMVPRARIEEAGGSAMGPDNLYFGEYWDLPPITMRIDDTRRLLGFEPTDFGRGLSETYAWYRSQPKRRPDYSFEDRLLAAGPSQSLH